MRHDVRAAQRLAFSGAAGMRLKRHGWWHETTFINRAQVMGRASGVRCKAMLGREDVALGTTI